jgi:hypothetical protein
MNYMNILSDFEIRVNRFIPDKVEHNEISKLNNLIKEKESIIEQQTAELQSLKKNSRKKSTGNGILIGEEKSIKGKILTGKKSLFTVKSRSSKSTKSSKKERSKQSE